MMDWLRTYFAPLPLTSYSLFGLLVLGTLEFLGLRQPIRDGIARGLAWMIAKALALRSPGTTVHHFTVIGANDPAAQKALAEMIRNAKRSGHRF